VAWLTGSQKKKERGEPCCSLIASGAAALVVGTHAVIQEQVRCAPGLAIIDEQHRFGVAAAAGPARQDGSRPRANMPANRHGAAPADDEPRRFRARWP
jgi:ATP-dependent DNA helicase RecG